jgi:Uma2 family endonuclease
LIEAERKGFAPLCPDLVVELASPSDEPQALRRKMAAYMANVASLGWLLLPQGRTVEVWTAAETANSPLVLNDPSRLEAGLEFPGLVIDPRRIWEVGGRSPRQRWGKTGNNAVVVAEVSRR